MQFKHPEILYALLLLLIPIIVHLFQLRRFQKIDFTNVAFLKKATIQTRKSSTLKKWLSLLARLLALACIILAFAQPFTATDKALNSEKETVIYIDNSFSMQAKGPNGPLLTNSLQQLYEELNGEENITWFTNDQTKKNVSRNDLKSEVLQIPYSQNSLSPDAVWLKAQQLFSSSKTADKRLIWISDFQPAAVLPIITDKGITVEAMQPQAVSLTNVSIDTAFVSSKKVESLQLQVQVSGTGELPENTAVSLFNNQQLIAKTAVEFNNANKGIVVFDIEHSDRFVGTLSLNDTQLQYDNKLYFSLNPTEEIKVLSIYQNPVTYLQKLYNSEHFSYQEEQIQQLNFSDIANQHFIILHELSEIPASLINALQAFHNDGGSLLIIPPAEGDMSGYNSLLNILQLGQLSTEPYPFTKKISKIHFNHPLFEKVFEKQVTNFQNPTVNSYYTLQGMGSKVLDFEDGSAFAVAGDRAYVFAAAINPDNSNFTNSPLIVPTLLNMAQQSLPLPNLYYNLNTDAKFALPISLGPDQIVSIKDSLQSIIPMQQSKAQSVEITITDELDHAGNYQVFLENDPIQYISFNESRTESTMTYTDLSNWEGVKLHSSMSEVFESLAQANEMNLLWKWFVIFAVLFLLFEMFILKFL